MNKSGNFLFGDYMTMKAQYVLSLFGELVLSSPESSPEQPPSPPKKDKTKQKQKQKNYPGKRKGRLSPESRPEFSPGFSNWPYETWGRVHMIICQRKIPYKFLIMSFFSLRTLFAPGLNYVNKWRRQYLFKQLEVVSTRSNRFCYQHRSDNI